jgi:hypothetical protein
MGSHLLFHQCHDVAHQQRATLPEHSDLGCLDSVPLLFAQHHVDCRVPSGATLSSTAHE